MSIERSREPSPHRYSKRESFMVDIKAEEIPHTLTLHQDYLSQLSENQIVADLGCGFGRFSDFLSRNKDVLVTGFDINPDGINEAERRAKISGNSKVIYEERDITDLLPISKLSEPNKFILTENMFDHAILVGTIGVVEEAIRTKMLSGRHISY